MTSATRAAVTQSSRRSILSRLLVVTGLLACGESKGSVTIRGDAPGLDSMGRVGDQLAAQLGRGPPSIDSIRAQLDATIRAAKKRGMADSTPVGGVFDTVNPVTSPSRSSDAGDIMTKRAQARGDSMARAAAARFSGGINAKRVTRGDTLRGVLTVVGTGLAKQVALRANGGASTVTLSGIATNGLAQLAGTEIMVRGLKTSPRDIVVLSYVVRAVGGVPAWDGVLQLTGGQWMLRLTEGGFKKVGSVPEVLKGRPGARIWMSIKSGGSRPEAYGAIPSR